MQSWLFFCALVLSQWAYSAIQVEQVESWALNHSEAKLEDFLEWVSVTDPAQLEWFTLMRQSESAQGASAEAPRAIVFGPESKFIFTFNGQAHQAGYQEVEMIFFKEAPVARWELRKLSFYPELKKVEFSKANPNSCLSCHQNPVRPIWNPYDIWPGAYGENDDAIPDFDNDKYATPGYHSSTLEERKKEFREFSQFLKQKDQHSRYSKLKFPEGSPVSPFSPQGRYFDYRFRPNLKLTESLVELHSKTLLAKMKAHPQYESSKALLLALTLQCEENFNDKNSEIGRQVLELEEKYRNSCVEPVAWNRRGYAGDTSRQHHLMFLLGIEASDFSLEKTPEYWSYFGGQYYSHEILMREIYRDVKSSFSELPVLDYYNGYGLSIRVPSQVEGEAKPVNEVCRILTKIHQSQGEIKNFSRASLSNPMATCLGCHSNESDQEAPYLPLEDKVATKATPGLLEKILARIDSEDPKIKMPPTRGLSQKEKEAIREWLLN